LLTCTRVKINSITYCIYDIIIVQITAFMVLSITSAFLAVIMFIIPLSGIVDATAYYYDQYTEKVI